MFLVMAVGILPTAIEVARWGEVDSDAKVTQLNIRFLLPDLLHQRWTVGGTRGQYWGLGYFIHGITRSNTPGPVWGPGVLSLGVPATVNMVIGGLEPLPASSTPSLVKPRLGTQFQFFSEVLFQHLAPTLGNIHVVNSHLCQVRQDGLDANFGHGNAGLVQGGETGARWLTLRHDVFRQEAIGVTTRSKNSH